jgi:hypothetical protein
VGGDPLVLVFVERDAGAVDIGELLSPYNQVAIVVRPATNGKASYELELVRRAGMPPLLDAAIELASPGVRQEVTQHVLAAVMSLGVSTAGADAPPPTPAQRSGTPLQALTARSLASLFGVLVPLGEGCALRCEWVCARVVRDVTSAQMALALLVSMACPTCDAT